MGGREHAGLTGEIDSTGPDAAGVLRCLHGSPDVPEDRFRVKSGEVPTECNCNSGLYEIPN